MKNLDFKRPYTKKKTNGKWTKICVPVTKIYEFEDFCR